MCGSEVFAWGPGVRWEVRCRNRRGIVGLEGLQGCRREKGEIWIGWGIRMENEERGMENGKWPSRMYSMLLGARSPSSRLSVFYLLQLVLPLGKHRVNLLDA